MTKTLKKTGAMDKEVTPKKECISCRKIQVVGNFFLSNSEFHKSDGGRFPVCKKCVTEKLPDENPESLEYIETSKNILSELNKPFVSSLWEISIEESLKTHKSLFGLYMKNLNFNKRDLTARDSDDQMGKSKAVVKSIEDTIDATIVLSPKVYAPTETIIEFTNEDVRAHQDCIKLLGYDPFAGYAMLDQKFLYGELVSYLDEDTLEDQYKISVIIQLLNNNNQIRKIDLLINKLSLDDKSFLKNHVEIKALTSVKSTIATNSDKLAKENSIAIKHRGDKKAGRSTLGYLMKDLRELGFEEAEEDYYDMKKTYGMQVSADISMKSIISQLNFDEKDMEDIFKDQRELILELQSQKEELEEKLRLSNLENKKLKKVVD